MKLRNHQFSTQPRIFEGSSYTHPWYKKAALVDYYGKDSLQLNRPNPPSLESIEKAQFTDKTYQWRTDNSVRSGNKRTTK